MELCKFYLMDCCAKKEKCLYMHGDFPCKYYYLGLKCQEKDKCLFSHGKPLTDQLRAILLKHLDTAPQEILGDFPRISRDNALNMVNTTHKQLLQKYNMADKSNTSSNIPSIFDLVFDKPSLMSNNDNKRNRKSRWCPPPSK
jgi:hypothetical protein